MVKSCQYVQVEQGHDDDSGILMDGTVKICPTSDSNHATPARNLSRVGTAAAEKVRHIFAVPAVRTRDSDPPPASVGSS